MVLYKIIAASDYMDGVQCFHLNRKKAYMSYLLSVSLKYCLARSLYKLLSESFFNYSRGFEDSIFHLVLVVMVMLAIIILPTYILSIRNIRNISSDIKKIYKSTRLPICILISISLSLIIIDIIFRFHYNNSNSIILYVMRGNALRNSSQDIDIAEYALIVCVVSLCVLLSALLQLELEKNSILLQICAYTFATLIVFTCCIIYAIHRGSVRSRDFTGNENFFGNEIYNTSILDTYLIIKDKNHVIFNIFDVVGKPCDDSKKHSFVSSFISIMQLHIGSEVKNNALEYPTLEYLTSLETRDSNAEEKYIFIIIAYYVHDIKKRLGLIDKKENFYNNSPINVECVINDIDILKIELAEQLHNNTEQIADDIGAQKIKQNKKKNILEQFANMYRYTGFLEVMKAKQDVKPKLIDLPPELKENNLGIETYSVLLDKLEVYVVPEKAKKKRTRTKNLWFKIIGRLYRTK